MLKECALKRAGFGLILGMFFITGFAEVRAQLNLSPPARVTARPGEAITIPLNLTNPAAQAIDAFGLKLLFPGAALEYDTVQSAGTLTNGWFVVNGNQTSHNEFTDGGFNITPITAFSGVLLQLKFRVRAGATGSVGATFDHRRAIRATVALVGWSMSIRLGIESSGAVVRTTS